MRTCIPELEARLQALLRAGDTLWWGQAAAEPQTVTRPIVRHRWELAQGGRLRVFGVTTDVRECLVAAIEKVAFIVECVSWLGFFCTSTHSVGEAPSTTKS
jgi:hypothetical protein